MPDVFISYAHKDNEYPRYESRGWVQCFYDALQARLNNIRGHETTIWRDQSEGRVKGLSLLTPTIKSALLDTKVLLTIVSPAYAASTWCTDELRYFKDATPISVGTSSRVIKVNKLPVASANSSNGDASEIDDAIGYQFYRKQTDGRPLEFDPPHGAELGTEFCRALNSLAYDIDSLLQQIAGDVKSASRVVPSTGIVVYLAEPTYDLRAQRDSVRTELQQFGHTVVPAADYPHDPDFAERVRTDLARARCSVHLIGDTYGTIPERALQSVVDIQFRLAGEEGDRRSEFVRLPWTIPGLTPVEDRQIAFLKGLQDDERLSIMPFEDFKSVIRDELAPKKRAEPGGAPGDDVKSVYLIFDPPDREAAKPVGQWLFDQGFEVLRPVSSDDPKTQRDVHKRHMNSSDGVLIYHGRTKESWLITKLNDLEKVWGYRSRKRPLLARGVVLAAPVTPDKEDFQSHKLTVIRGFADFSTSMLQAFIDELRRRERELP